MPSKSEKQLHLIYSQNPRHPKDGSGFGRTNG